MNPLRVPAALLALSLATTLTGCRGDDDDTGPVPFPSLEDGGEPADPAGTATLPDAAFDARVRSDGAEVTVGYTLTNTSEREMLVVDLLPRPSGAGTAYTSETLYVTGQDSGRVLLSQRVFAWPEGAQVAFAQAPEVGGTRLAPRESLTGRAVTTLPLERNHPFGDDLGYGDIALPDDAGEAVFCLGVISPPYPASLGPREKDGVTVLAHGSTANRAQYLFCSEPAPLD